MESTLVIKVKCGDTLRRFNTSIVENRKLGLNVEQLREKMRSLFNLAADDEFTLTYTDTDGDSVTLVDDCDLDDVVLQRINPVRMVLVLKKSGRTDSLGNNDSTEIIQTSVERVVKSVPEPLRGVLLQLTKDLAAIPPAPVIADIIHSASKIGESFACKGSRKESDVETSDADANVKDKEVKAGVCRVPDLNHVPLPPSGNVAYFPFSDTFSNGKREMRCPMFANGGLATDVKRHSGCPMVLKPRPDVWPHGAYKGDRSAQFKRSHSHSDSAAPVSHTGVRCDGCDVYPITGPRFKSKVKHNYDLCSSCYQKSGSEADYVCIDSPMMYHHIMKALHRKHGGNGQQSRTYIPFKPVADPYVPFTVKPISPVNQVKLDSRFILDVTVMDGTMMAPSTHFTKIWKMQNNGNVAWPVGTQLVWTDGDNISNALSVDLEITSSGVPVDGAIDVAVDFIAPELPGEYVSYWRMSSASGQKFGQRVWVAIQVNASLSPDPLSDSFSQLNLSLPPQRNGQNGPVVIDINVEPPPNNTFSPSNLYPSEAPVETGTVKVVLQATSNSPLVIEPVSQDVSGKGSVENNDRTQESQGGSSEIMGFASNEQDVNFPINDFLLVGEPLSNSYVRLPVTVTVPSVSYPVVDSSKIEAGAMPMSTSSNVAYKPQSEVFNETEESLLKQLLEMGFGQVDLNREMLRKNSYDMEKTVVDLWDISEWDPIMDELQEMGFSDKKKNAILLVKNKGSIKRVVMDLVAGDMLQ